MRILVTGGAGFIGSRLALGLEKDGHDVTVVDRSPERKQDNLSEFNGKIKKADVSDFDFWQNLNGEFDAVFHQAACTDTTVKDEGYMMEQNFGTFERLLKWAEERVVDVIYASSAATYGNSPSPQRAGKGEKPLNLYGKSKLKMDELVRTNLPSSTIKIIGLRYFNVYGPGESFKKHMASMIFKLAKQMKSGKRPRIFYDGEQKRDQIYVADVVQANLLALKAKKDKSGIYNVGTGLSVSFNEIVMMINKILGTNFEPDYFENPHDFYQNHTQADIGLTKETLGFEPVYNPASGIAAYVESGKL